jgi:hypothetical protein
MNNTPLANRQQIRVMELAQQIADNNRCQGDIVQSAQKTLRHIRLFWPQSMRQTLLECRHHDIISPVLVQVLVGLKQQQ